VAQGRNELVCKLKLAEVKALLRELKQRCARCSDRDACKLTRKQAAMELLADDKDRHIDATVISMLPED